MDSPVLSDKGGIVQTYSSAASCFHLTHHKPAGAASQSPALFKASPAPVPGGVATLHTINPAPKTDFRRPPISPSHKCCYLALSSSLLNAKVAHIRTEGKEPGVFWIESHPPISGRGCWHMGSYLGAGRGGPPREIWLLCGSLPTWGP